MDWDAAYSNSDAVANSAQIRETWAERSAAFRAEASSVSLDIAYGAGARERYDLFQPAGDIRGLAVFVHGGYWRLMSKDMFSHLAAGPLAHGWAVAMPSYTLCPETRITQITRQVGAAITHAAAQVTGPIRIAGHSAGGHLVSRMACTDAPIGTDVSARLHHVLSISGVHDLRPLMNTAMNADLKLDDAEAMAESPVLRHPRAGTRLTAWVGGAELPEFLRQTALLANVWTGLGAWTQTIEDTRRNHFDVIDGLADPASPITRCWLED